MQRSGSSATHRYVLVAVLALLAGCARAGFRPRAETSTPVELGLHLPDLPVQPGITLLAGNPDVALGSGPVGAVSPVLPHGIAVEPASGTIYFADVGARLIRAFSPGASPQITTVAGRGFSGHDNGANASARFEEPTGLELGPDGALYVADSGASVISRVSLDATGTTTTFAGQPYDWTTKPGPLATASFGGTASLVWSGGALFVDNVWDGQIFRIAGGQASWWSGAGMGAVDGPAATAKFDELLQLAADGSGAIFAAEPGQHRVRRFATDGSVSTVAGSVRGFQDGPVKEALFDRPSGVAVTADGLTIYVADSQNDRVRKISGGVVTTLAGSAAGFADGTGTGASFRSPVSLGLTASGALLVSDAGNAAIRSVSPAGVVTTLFAHPAPDGVGSSARLHGPLHGTLAPDGSLLIAEESGRRIRRVTPAGVVSTVAGDGHLYWPASARLGFDRPSGVALDPAGNLYFVSSGSGGHAVEKIAAGGQASRLAGGRCCEGDGTGTEARFSMLTDIVYAGGALYVGDRNRVRKVSLQGEVTTLAGSTTPGFAEGTGSAARFRHVAGLAVDGSGDLLVADLENSAVRRVVPATGKVSTLVGSGWGYKDGPVGEAQLQAPTGLAVGADGTIYVADTGNRAVRAISSAGSVSTVAGNGTPGYANGDPLTACLRAPTGVIVRPDGKALYVLDRDSHAVRLLILK